MHKSYPLFVFGFHGCERSVAEKVLSGKEDLKPSENPYDWLGTGIYFWENAPERALQWARERKKKDPCVIGAVIQLSCCLNLMDKGSAAELKDAYETTLALSADKSAPLPENAGGLHRLDTFVINTATRLAEANGRAYDAVRGAFVEGDAVFPGSSVRADTHIQLCVRNPGCVVAYFRPKAAGGAP